MDDLLLGALHGLNLGSDDLLSDSIQISNLQLHVVGFEEVLHHTTVRGQLSLAHRRDAVANPAHVDKSEHLGCIDLILNAQEGVEHLVVLEM